MAKVAPQQQGRGGAVCGCAVLHSTKGCGEAVQGEVQEEGRH